MKRIENIFALLGFAFSYIIPLVLFGGVIPYTHDSIGAGLTKMGYIALGVLLIIVARKIKARLLARNKSLVRALLLSAFPIVFWIFISVALGWLSSFLLSLSEYWDKVLLFIILGRLFYTVSEVFGAKESEVDENEGG